ncbi:hypothetical protein [Nocardioides sp.]|uniref:hypothetical protein n=1 Tax=Nocardioides sp. TaxID=35761 RepID=UPI002B6DD8FE|nr:hypothetical protein [Nocardioides sp.]HXH78778.1 hypothetical protein [Nocardioides sp.]
MGAAIGMAAWWIPPYAQLTLRKWARRHHVDLQERSGRDVRFVLRSIHGHCAGFFLTIVADALAILVLVSAAASPSFRLTILASAVLFMAGAAIPAVIAHSYWRPQSGVATLRTVTVRGYVGRTTVVCAVALGATAAAPVVVALVAGASPAYRAADLWWETSVVVPLLAGSVIVFLLTLPPISEPAPKRDEPGGGVAYAWDIFRSTSLFVALCSQLPVLAYAVNATIGSLDGLALAGAVPVWAQHASSLLRMVTALQVVLLLIMLVSRRRPHKSLRPTLADGELVPFPGAGG